MKSEPRLNVCGLKSCASFSVNKAESEPNVLQDQFSETFSRPGSTSCSPESGNMLLSVCFQAAGDRDPHLIYLIYVTQICFYF